jgi:hypothetical protein
MGWYALRMECSPPLHQEPIAKSDDDLRLEELQRQARESYRLHCDPTVRNTCHIDALLTDAKRHPIIPPPMRRGGKRHDR